MYTKVTKVHEGVCLCYDRDNIGPPSTNELEYAVIAKRIRKDFKRLW